MTVKDTAISYLVMIYFIMETWYRIFISRFYLNKFNSKQSWHVLRTWFYLNTIDEQDNYNDKYFGWLPDYLISKNKNLIVIAGVFNDYHKIVKRIAKHEGHIIFTPEFFMSYWSPLRTVLKANNKGYSGKSVITSLRSRQNILSMQGLSNQFKIETWICLHENLLWEKMCLMYFTPGRHVKTIGYQHTLLSDASNNMMIDKDSLIPDKIVTIGWFNKKFLITHGYNKDNVVVGGNLKFKLPSRDVMLPRDTGVKVLIALRGIPTVSERLLGFISKAGLVEHGYNVVVRHHPNKDSNIKPLEQDLKGSCVVLYDSSMVALEALAYGVPVIHISLNDVNNDPLDMCEDLHWSVDKPNELIGVIDRVHSLSDIEFNVKQEMSRAFVEDYLTEATEERIKEFL
jgi:hypothetical protein